MHRKRRRWSCWRPAAAAVLLVGLLVPGALAAQEDLRHSWAASEGKLWPSAAWAAPAVGAAPPLFAPGRGGRPLVAGGAESRATFGRVWLGSAIGWSAALGFGELLDDEGGGGVFLLGPIGAGFGAAIANDFRGAWWADILVAGGLGLPMILPAMGVCWERCTRTERLSVELATGVVHTVAATLVERATEFVRVDDS